MFVKASPSSLRIEDKHPYIDIEYIPIASPLRSMLSMVIRWDY
jgi:hypothetical protein